MVFSRKFLLAAAALVASNSVTSALARKFIIKNQCPLPAVYYINGENQGPIPAQGGQVERELDNNFSGFIYTDTNGGNQNGVGTTRAGFFLERSYYYLVANPDRTNVGVSIITNGAQRQGYCGEATCSSSNCGDAFSSPPTDHPPRGSTAPNPPYHACPFEDVVYTITFCPNWDYPTGQGPVTLHPNGNPDKCLDVRGALYENGTPVQIYDCNGTGAQRWRISAGLTKVRLDGTNFCLDAGSAPASGTGMKIWQCYDNLPAQSWYYTNDGRIALNGALQCVDLTDGGLWNGNQVQTWQCTANNLNQVWTVI
ncbi:hypothetical protein AX16_005791 [Volvariella volvacea WC 439]|nr:hypothetical protein AX16_005791 [Volvariella volvacea WC 439]